jgi:formylglycine-generating enzyme required for sulfatase activity
MRGLPVIVFMVVGSSLLASELCYPLWDGHESVADYCKRVNLPAVKTLDLGEGVKMELVLIPGGRFVMGTAEPVRIDESLYETQIVIEKTFLAITVVALLVMLIRVGIRAVRNRHRPQVSLVLLLLVTVTAGCCLLSGVQWWRSALARDMAWAQYNKQRANYDLAEYSEKPAHSVTLAKPFYMGKFLVTQEQYQQEMGINPSEFKGNKNPVDSVSWNDAQGFCNHLQERLKQSIRLPTEAEWEYVCRSGTTGTYYSGELDSDVDQIAWYSLNSKSTTHPVGTKVPNAFGVYDMLGNVWESCVDFYDGSYYAKSPREDPQGGSNGDYRVMRGGAWDREASYCRCATRYGGNPERRSNDLGFRVVMLVPAVQR